MLPANNDARRYFEFIPEESALGDAILDETSAQFLFRGLLNHLFDARVSGRIEVWANAAHSIVDLLASGPPHKNAKDLIVRGPRTPRETAELVRELKGHGTWQQHRTIKRPKGARKA